MVAGMLLGGAEGAVDEAVEVAIGEQSPEHRRYSPAEGGIPPPVRIETESFWG